MLDYWHKNWIILLLAPKRSEKVGKINNPRYCGYHQVISHLLKKFIMLKEHILYLARDRRIILDLDDSVKTNYISAQVEHSPLSWKQSPIQSY